jgi:alkanesulfonate monooxygenase SsuD/methylene tetrahydromethanopterin reductase-like flavin-dependent oxidoreductase (luciferase family)
LADTVQIIRKMWTETPATFHGKYYQIEDAYCEPKPDPLPPIMIGGGGEQLTLRVVARYADWWNLGGGTPESFAHKLDVLRSHCAEVGRDPDDIVKTVGGVVAIAESEAEAQRIAKASPFSGGQGIVGTPDQVTAQLRAFTDLGVTHFILRFADFPHPAGIDLFAQTVIPQFR